MSFFPTRRLREPFSMLLMLSSHSLLRSRFCRCGTLGRSSGFVFSGSACAPRACGAQVGQQEVGDQHEAQVAFDASVPQDLVVAQSQILLRLLEQHFNRPAVQIMIQHTQGTPTGFVGRHRNPASVGHAAAEDQLHAAQFRQPADALGQAILLATAGRRQRPRRLRARSSHRWPTSACRDRGRRGRSCGSSWPRRRSGTSSLRTPG